MASELYVETLKGLTSGANANKIVVPAGQTLDASAGTLTPSSGQIIQVVRKSSNNNTGASTTSFAEIDSDYRVSITPTSTSSIIYLTYTLPINMYYSGHNSGNIMTFQPYNFTGSRVLTDNTGTDGSRLQGLATRPPGDNENDMVIVSFQAIDEPNSLSAQAYGFRSKHQSSVSATSRFGRSENNNSDWGWVYPIVITAMEIAG